MTDYKAVAASLRACTDPQKRHAADVIDALVLDLAERTAELMAAIHYLPGDVKCGDLQRARDAYKAISPPFGVLHFVAGAVLAARSRPAGRAAWKSTLLPSPSEDGEKEKR